MEQSLIRQLIHLLPGNGVPILSVLAWGLFALMTWTFSQFIRDLLAVAQQMHRIPCAHCRFFTRDYHLKCTVRPTSALTEDAIHCSDFQP